MNVSKINNLDFGVAVQLDTANASDAQIDQIKQMIYAEKLVVLKNQTLSPKEFVDFGRKMGTLREYYEKMYHHPEQKEIFVSSNIKDDKDKEVIGVPRTGAFWHSDYAFMQEPFAFTITYPQIVPRTNRGTYFIDMAQSYAALSDELKQIIEATRAEQSVRTCFKVRPEDIYRPLGEIMKEIEQKTPAVFHPTVITHPVTGEKILYVSEGFTQSLSGLAHGHDSEEVLDRLLKEIGQRDKTFGHPHIHLLNVEPGDIIIWDNRRFVHHAKHSGVAEPSKTFRLTAYDEHGFSATAQ